MSDEAVEREYHFDGSDPDLVLLERVDKPGSYTPFDKRRRIVLVIADEDDNEHACRRLMDAGCEVLKELPQVTLRTALVSWTSRLLRQTVAFWGKRPF
jgi:hypothetical protein